MTCLDPRVVPEQFFGPDFRNAVIRNAGGRVSKDVINSITVLRSLADASAVLVIHHTGKHNPITADCKVFKRDNFANEESDCGMTHLTEDGIRHDVKKRTPDAAGEIPDEPYGCLAAEDFEKAIKDDVEKLRKSKVLARVEIRGMALETETGVVRQLDF